MATYTSDMVAGNQSFKPFPSGALGVRYAKFEATTALASGDILQLVDVFSGETVHDVIIKVDDLDSGSSIEFDIGDGGDVDYYIDGSTVGRNGGTDEKDAAVAPKEYTADDTIDMKVTASPGGGGTGTIELWVYVS